MGTMPLAESTLQNFNVKACLAQGNRFENPEKDRFHRGGEVLFGYTPGFTDWPTWDFVMSTMSTGTTFLKT
jgi:hypothetical protein